MYCEHSHPVYSQGSTHISSSTKKFDCEVGSPQIIHSTLPLHDRSRHYQDNLIPSQLYAKENRQTQNIQKRDKSRDLPGFMEPTTSSVLRQKKQVNLREKIFLEHWGVNNPHKSNKPPTPVSGKADSHRESIQRGRTHSRGRSEDMVPTKQVSHTSNERKPTYDYTKLERTVERIDNQNSVMKQALGTLADAVSEELEDIRKHVISSGHNYELRHTATQNKLDHLNLNSVQAESNLQQVQIDCQQLKDECLNRIAQYLQKGDITPSMAPSSAEVIHPGLDQKFQTLKLDTKKLFEQMKTIMQQCSLQTQTNTHELERLDYQLEQVRDVTSGGVEKESELVRRMIRLEREFQASSKSQASELQDVQQLANETETIMKKMRFQLEQNESSLHNRSFEINSNQSDQMQTIQIKVEQQDRSIKKCTKEIDDNCQQIRDLNRQFQSGLTQRLDAIETQRVQSDKGNSRKIASIEDLFETQRKELFSRMTELEKHISQRFSNVNRAVTEIGGSLKLDTSQFLSDI